jgi:hypothetical protein
MASVIALALAGVGGFAAGWVEVAGRRTRRPRVRALAGVLIATLALSIVLALDDATAAFITLIVSTATGYALALRLVRFPGED